MCIVIVKAKGIGYPTKEQIKNSADNNPDGFAMAWAYKGRLHNYKTMDKKKFLAKYDELTASMPADDVAMIIHTRIATHGSKNEKNCHCWIRDNVAFAHNGILDVKNRGDMTDSETFFADIFMPIFRKYGWEKAELAINAVIGTSKFAFLQQNGEIHHYGNYNTVGGVLFSNTSYESRSYVYSRYDYDDLYGVYGVYGGYGKYANYAKSASLIDSKKSTEKDDKEKAITKLIDVNGNEWNYDGKKWRMKLQTEKKDEQKKEKEDKPKTEEELPPLKDIVDNEQHALEFTDAYVKLHDLILFDPHVTRHTLYSEYHELYPSLTMADFADLIWAIYGENEYYD